MRSDAHPHWVTSPAMPFDSFRHSHDQRWLTRRFEPDSEFDVLTAQMNPGHDRPQRGGRPRRGPEGKQFPLTQSPKRDFDVVEFVMDLRLSVRRG